MTEAAQAAKASPAQPLREFDTGPPSRRLRSGPLAGRRRHIRSNDMKTGGTCEQQLVFLNTHWGRQYSFAAPGEPGGQWTATAKFGQQDQIQEWSAAELLEEVRGHYQANRPKAKRGDGS